MLRRLGLLVLASVLAGGLALTGVLPQGAPPPASAYPLGDGYILAAQDGGIFTFGAAQFYGSTGGMKLNAPIVGAAPHPFLEGYWLVASDGGIFSFGSSGFHGSLGNRPLNAPIVGMASTPSGLGYWLVASDGGIFTFGDAEYLGSLGGSRLNQPIVGIAVTPSGDGYWLVARDGGIFTFGDAKYFGSEGGTPLNKPVTGMASTPSGGGYYLVANDGGIFTHGDAVFRGSRGGQVLNAPVTGMALSPTGNGYQLVATDGGIFNYGDSVFYGSTGAMKLNRPVFGMALRPRLAVKVDAYGASAGQTSAWVQNGSDWVLRLTSATGAVPAGARVFGVEGLDGGQLGKLSFTVDAGTCDAGVMFNLAYDADRNGKGDTARTFSCATATADGAKRTFDLAAAGVPNTALVTSLDITSTRPTIDIDDINVVGITVPDFGTYRL